MGIDEAGTDDQVRGVDSFSSAIGDLADLGDFPVTYREVGAVTGTASTVNNSPIFDYDVIRHKQRPQDSRGLQTDLVIRNNGQNRISVGNGQLSH
jgi:hypothetical protein